MKTKSEFAKTKSAVSLHLLCKELVDFRSYLLEMRAALPAPGYHLDLCPTRAAKAAAFLTELPHTAAALCKKVRGWQKAHSEKYFDKILETLRSLRKDPAALFTISAQQQDTFLDTSAELSVLIQNDPKALSTKKPVSNEH